jgi:uncharacterized protein (TIGR02594 family)
VKPSWLEIAENEIGTVEIPGPEHNPKIVLYHSFTTLKAQTDEVPWCSSFVNYCMEMAGYKGTRSAAARSWLKWGKPLIHPKEGCIVVMSRGSNPTSGHVGFFTRNKPAFVEVLGGNQSNKVCTQWFSVAKILAYRWPLDTDKLPVKEKSNV